MEWKIPLAEPDIGQEEIEAITQVLKSKWLTMGPVTAEFERKFAEKMNVKYAFALNNCTAALHLANVALGITTGDEVICPALTFVASANATRYTGANVIFADVVSEQELTIDPKDIEKKITKKTKAITVVHYAGFPCLMDEIIEIARKYNLKVIEDCAHAPFAYHPFKDGTKKYVGAIGDVGCFSFFGNKNMTTGEGGMLTTNNDSIAEKIRLLRSHGMTTLTYDRHKGHASSYDVVALGYNYRTDELHSAIGLCQLEKIDRLNENRRIVFKWYLDLLMNNKNIIVPFAHRNLQQATCHIFPIMVKRGCENIKLRLKDAGVQTSKHYNLISSFSAYKKDLEKLILFDPHNLITLPLGPNMSHSEVEYIVSFLGIN
jgi:dTDP-4-amino-4,6-dideoxygalactose transaminase